MNRIETVDQLEHLGSLITIKGTNNCLGYLMDFTEQGHGVHDATYGQVPVPPEHVKAHNAALSKAMIEGLDTTCKVGQGQQFYFSRGERQPGRSPTLHVVKTFDGVIVSDAVVHVSSSYYRFRRNGREFQVMTNRENESCFVKRIV